MRMRFTSLVAATLLLLATSASAFEKTWDGGSAANSNWLTASNWAGDMLPVAGDTLIFPSVAARKTNVNNYPADTTFAEIRFTGSDYSISGNRFILTGSVNGQNTTLSNTFIPDIVLSGGLFHQFTVNSGGTLFIAGALSGSGSLAKLAGGILHVTGFNINTYTGVTAVDAGTLLLSRGFFGGATAVPGDLMIGPGATVRIFGFGDQISNTSNVTVNAGATLDLNNFSDRIGSLTLNGGIVTTVTPPAPPAPGTLTLGGDVTGTGGTISGNVNLFGATRTFTVTGTGLLTIAAVISDGAAPAGINKAGAGTLSLDGNNTYRGLTQVLGGILRIGHANALGTTAAGTTVVSGAQLQVPIDFTGAEQLVLHGSGPGGTGALSTTALNVTWTAAVILDAPARITVVGATRLTISGVVSGNALEKDGVGTLLLSNANTIPSAITVMAGVLNASHSNALGTTAQPTTVASGATLEINANGIAEPLVINSNPVSGLGGLRCVAPAAMLLGSVTVNSGSIGGADGTILTLAGPVIGDILVKVGSNSSTLVVAAVSTYTGSTEILNGTLRLGAAEVIPNNSVVGVAPGAAFDLNNFNETIRTVRPTAGFTSAGAIALGSGTLTLVNPAGVFNGIISGAGGLTLNGPGTFTLSGNNTYSGPTTIGGTVVEIAGTQPSSPITLTSGNLSGTGVTGSINATSGSVGLFRLPGTLRAAGNVSLTSASTLTVPITGAVAGTTYGQLDVTGAVSLGNATLTATLGYTPASGDTWMVVRNDGSDPVSGTFAGLLEGSLFSVATTALRITYRGGDGNDIVLSPARTTTYLAEGATSSFFDTTIALFNPQTVVPSASVTLQFLKADGTSVTHALTLPSFTRATVNVKDIPGLAAAEFSTVVDSSVPIVVDRTMWWDARGYGAHAEKGIPGPATTWYLAEGATHSGFNLFYLLQNANSTAASVQVSYLRPGGLPPLVKTYTVAANSRFNIWVNNEAVSDPALAGLASAEISAVLSADRPIIVERAMYLNAPGRPFNAGHESAGVTAPATTWFLAEGATGNYFDLFVLIANPSGTAAAVTATYLLPDGTNFSKSYTVVGNSRFNIYVDDEDARLADTAVSITITSTVPVIVERAMWWPGGSATWQEAHNSPGSTETGTLWAVAEGEVGGTRALETYILIANTSSFAATVEVAINFEDGTGRTKTFPLNPNSRFNVNMAAEYPDAVGRRFATVVRSLGATPAQLVVERAMYGNAEGVIWAAGTNAIGWRLQ